MEQSVFYDFLWYERNIEQKLFHLITKSAQEAMTQIIMSVTGTDAQFLLLESLFPTKYKKENYHKHGKNFWSLVNCRKIQKENMKSGKIVI